MTSVQRQQIVDEYYTTGGPEAADAVVAAYWPLLRQWTRRYRLCHVAADDLLQIAAIGLLKSLARFDPRRSRFDTYAYHCVQGELRHYLRDHAGIIRMPRAAWQRGKEPVVRSLDAGADPVVDRLAAGQIGRDEPDLGHADDRIQLWEMLRDLHPEQGAALLLWIGFQLPQRAVASVLGVPQTSVSRLCARGLRTLRARLSEQGRSTEVVE